MTKQLTLGKEERLKSRKQIEQLFSEGKKFTAAPFRVHYLYDRHEKVPVQFGVGVSARNFKKAVDRNRIKRLTREAYRLQKLPLQQKLKEQNKQLVIFFIYTGNKVPDYAEVADKMSTILDKLNRIIFSAK